MPTRYYMSKISLSFLMNNFHRYKNCQLIKSTKSGTSDISGSFHLTPSFTWVLLTSFKGCSSIYQLSSNFLSPGPLSLSSPVISKEGFYTLKPCMLAKDMVSRVRLPMLRLLLHYYKLCDLGCVIWLLLTASRNSYNTRRVAYNRRLLYTPKKKMKHLIR